MQRDEEVMMTPHDYLRAIAAAAIVDQVYDLWESSHHAVAFSQAATSAAAGWPRIFAEWTPLMLPQT